MSKVETTLNNSRKIIFIKYVIYLFVCRLTYKEVVIMKKYFLFVLLVLPAVLLLSCGTSNQNDGDLDGQTVAGDEENSLEKELKPTTFAKVNDLEGIEMKVKENTVSPTGSMVVFENDTEKECIYGEYFVLEKKIEDSWYEVPVTLDGEYGFDDIGYGLAPWGTSEWSVEWEWLYGSLDSGEYRIVKDLLDFREAGDFDKYFMAAEFVIGS